MAFIGLLAIGKIVWLNLASAAALQCSAVSVGRAGLAALLASAPAMATTHHVRTVRNGRCKWLNALG